jgi:hypothetical protein
MQENQLRSDTVAKEKTFDGTAVNLVDADIYCEGMNDGHAQGVSSQQARIEEITKETWSLGTERDELKARIRELEAELEARKKDFVECDR